MAAANNDNEHVRSVEELKRAFKEGATPDEKDYGALIDLAAVGSKALGAKDATPTTPEPGAGLKMDKGKLTVSAGKGVTVDQNGVAVKGDRMSVTVTEAGVGIQVKPDGGLTTDAGEGLHVKEGAGMTSTADGLAIHLAGNSGLKADKDGLAVNVATGLGFDGKGALEVKLKKGSDNYITSGNDGLAITQAGVAAIEGALKSVSLDALDRADAATSHGFKVDATPGEATEGVQKKIAVKLNEAFREGWHLTQPREALFTALMTFRATNKAKVYNEGLIAPSAVTGHPGLYNQGGAEYTTGTVIAYKVSPSGVAEVVNSGLYTEEGIYALVGKLDTAGAPMTGASYEKVTTNALMVLVAQTEVTVVGHWDFKVDADWTGTAAAGGWWTGPPIDGVVKEAELRAKAKAAEAPEYTVGEDTNPLTATRNGQELLLIPEHRDTGTHRMDNYRSAEQDGRNLVTYNSIGFSAVVYGQRLVSGKLSGDLPHDQFRGKATQFFQMTVKNPGLEESFEALQVRGIVVRNSLLMAELVWQNTRLDDDTTYTVDLVHPDANFTFEMDGPVGGIHTIFRFA